MRHFASFAFALLLGVQPALAVDGLIGCSSKGLENLDILTVVARNDLHRFVEADMAANGLDAYMIESHLSDGVQMAKVGMVDAIAYYDTNIVEVAEDVVLGDIGIANGFANWGLKCEFLVEKPVCENGVPCH